MEGVLALLSYGIVFLHLCGGHMIMFALVSMYAVFTGTCLRDSTVDRHEMTALASNTGTRPKQGQNEQISC